MDSIVAEVRTAREQYARRFNYDLHAMCLDLRREQERSHAKVVTLPRRPVSTAVAPMPLPTEPTKTQGGSELTPN